MVDRSCDICGVTYTAKRPSSKYCSDTCRKRASRGVVPATQAPVTLIPTADTEAGPVESILMDELTAVECVATTLGQAALALARRVDIGRDTGAGLASLVKQLEATKNAATANVKSAASPLDLMRDELAERRTRGA